MNIHNKIIRLTEPTENELIESIKDSLQFKVVDCGVLPERKELRVLANGSDLVFIDIESDYPLESRFSWSDIIEHNDDYYGYHATASLVHFDKNISTYQIELERKV